MQHLKITLGDDSYETTRTHRHWKEIVDLLLDDQEPPLGINAVELYDEIRALADDLTKILDDPGMDDTLKNKKGVELHGKVRRARERFQTLRDSGTLTQEDTDRLRGQLAGVTRKLLAEIFGIDPAEVEKALAEVDAPSDVRD